MKLHFPTKPKNISHHGSSSKVSDPENEVKNRSISYISVDLNAAKSDLLGKASQIVHSQGIRLPCPSAPPSRLKAQAFQIVSGRSHGHTTPQTPLYRQIKPSPYAEASQRLLENHNLHRFLESYSKKGHPKLLLLKNHYNNLMNIFRHAEQSTNIKFTKRFLSFCSKKITPKLNCEAAFMQFLSLAAYLYLEPGDELKVYVKKRIQGSAPSSQSQVQPHSEEDDFSYAVDCVVETYIGDKVSGLRMLHLTPKVHSDKVNKRDIIVFQGTALPPNAICHQAGYASGLYPDFDPKGIGQTAFEACAKQFDALLEGIFQSKNNRWLLTLTGHSLGGVYAQRLYARIKEKYPCPEDALQKLRVCVDAAPALDRDTALKAQATPENVHMLRNPCDWITGAGQKHLAGLGIYAPKDSPSDIYGSHTYRWLVAQALKGEPPTASLMLLDPPSTSQRIENFRVGIGNMLAWLEIHKDKVWAQGAKPSFPALPIDAPRSAR